MTVEIQKSGLLVASVLVTSLLVGCQGDLLAAKTQAAEMALSLKANVSVIEAKMQPVTLFDELQGRVVAYRTAEIRPQVSGMITQRLFKQGEFIANEQPLFQINKEPFVIDIKEKEASLAQAKVNLEQTKRQYRRLQALDKTSAVSKQAFDEASFNYKKASANVMQNAATLEQSKLNLEFATIRAPISGIIEQALVTEGTLVSKGDSQDLAIIKQIGKVYIDVRQPASKLSLLRKLVTSGTQQELAEKQKTNPRGLDVNILVSDDKAENMTGQIVFSGISVDVHTGDLIVRIIAENEKHTLLPGMYVRTEIPRRKLDAFLLPQQAIQRKSNGDAYVAVVTASDKVEQRVVKLDGIQNFKYVVSQGVHSGDKIIVEGHENLMPEAVLNISQWQPSELVG